MDDHQFRQVLNDVLDERRSQRGPGPEQHADDHEFIRIMREREKRRIERHEKIKQHVIGWGIIVAISSIGTLVYKGLMVLLGKNGG